MNVALPNTNYISLDLSSSNTNLFTRKAIFSDIYWILHCAWHIWPMEYKSKETGQVWVESLNVLFGNYIFLTLDACSNSPVVKRIDYDDENNSDMVMIMVGSICLTGTVTCFIFLSFKHNHLIFFFTLEAYQLKNVS